jgi:hypothetical protein
MSVRLRNIISLVKLLTATAMLLIFSAFRLPQKQGEGVLIWHNVPLKVKVSGFYITHIVDERADKKIIARLIPIAAAAGKNIAEPVTLQGGGLFEIEDYLKRNAPYQYNYKPVIIKVKKLLINEAALPDGRVEWKDRRFLIIQSENGRGHGRTFDKLYRHSALCACNMQADVCRTGLKNGY